MHYAESSSKSEAKECGSQGRQLFHHLFAMPPLTSVLPRSRTEALFIMFIEVG